MPAASGSRVLIIYGEQAASSRRGQHASVRTTRASTPPACWAPPASAPSSRPVPATARGALADAAAAALQGGAAALLLPVNVQLAEHGSRQGAAAAGARAATAAGAAARRRPSTRPPRCCGRAASRVIVAGLGAHRAGAKAAIEQLADRTGALARDLGARQGHVPRPSVQSRHRRLVLAFGRPAHDRPGRLRAGVRRRPQSPHHELRRIRCPRCRSSRSMPTEATSAAGIRPTSPWWAMRGSRREALLEALPPGSNAERPFRSDGDAALPRRASTSRATSSRRNTAAHGRSALARRGAREAAAGAIATSSTTPATSSASCPTCPCRDRATSS